MKSSRWDEVDGWFTRALGHRESERRAVLKQCADPEVRQRVERLLDVVSRTDDLLVTGGAAAVMVEDREAAMLSSARRVFAPGRELLDRYRVIDELGVGGMGLVLRALDLKLEREVAIKVVAGAADPDRLMREARIAASLNHQNLVAVYDAGEIDKTPFIVMELVDGPTLEEQPPKTEDDAVRVALQICHALEELHRKGIVHRDIKPSNLLCVETGGAPVVKLADLGVARSHDDTRITLEGRIIGTPYYMAPEQVRGETVDGRSDLYALGIMLYRWLTGRLPFAGSDAMVVLSQHLHAPVVGPREVRGDLSPEIEAVVLRLLAKDPRDRYASAAELADVLAHIPGPDPDRTPRLLRPTGGLPESSLERGRKALEEGRWIEAYEALSAASETGRLEPEDLGRLATAAACAGRHDEILKLLEATAAAYARNEDPRGVAATACELATVYYERRQPARSAAWLRRAERLLPDLSEGPEHAFVAWLRGRSFWESRRWEEATVEAERALEIARRVRDPDREALALLDLGHLLLVDDRYDEGASRLAEAGGAALSGELSPVTAGTVLCGLIFAWRACGNWARAAEWTQAQTQWLEREGVAPFPGICRVHRGELIRLRGDLGQAERDLAEGTEELVGVDNWVAAIGYRELGEVRLRRGKLGEAEAAFRRALELGSDAQPGLARLRLVEGDAEAALEGLRRALNSKQKNFLDEQNRLYLLPTLVTAALSVGDREEAERYAAELERVAEELGSGAHRAAASGARGELLLAEGQARPAIENLQEAWRSWSALDAPYEAAEVKVLIAQALERVGDERGARLELEAALSVFERLGAQLGVQRVREHLDRLEPALRTRNTPPDKASGAWAFAQVVDAPRLIEALGQEAWSEFEAWLHRSLSRCCREHSGDPGDAEHQPGTLGAGFPGIDDAVRCAIEMQTALREHRSRHGFAPPMRIGVTDRAGLDRARELAELAGPGDIVAARDAVAESVWRSEPGSRNDVVRLLW